MQFELTCTQRDIQKAAKEFAEKEFELDLALELEKEGNWANQSSCGLTSMKRELLAKLGSKDAALESAWDEFKKYPEEYTYDELMKYIPKDDYEHWHKKAIDEAKSKSLSGTIEICIKTREYDILNESIISAGNEQLEDIIYTTTQKAAEILIKRYPLSAAKIYCALGINILKSKKSKYYKVAVENFHRAKSLYEKSNNEKEWLSLVDDIYKNYSRKYSFMNDFEKLVSGKYPENVKSFIEKTKERWKKQTE